jgi:chromosome segregation ATPase
MGGKAKESPTQTPSDRLARGTARLKLLADQRAKLRKQADELQEVISRRQADLTVLNAALAKLEKDYAETAAACAPAGAKRAAGSAEVPPTAESISVLDGISRILKDGAYLDTAYAEYAAQCERTQQQPEPAALWISKAASAEVEKAKDLLMLTRMGEATPKRRQVATPRQDAQP